MAGEIRAIHLLIGGTVQGVGYRQWAVRNASELGLFGWVRNLADGRVELHAEGDGAKVDILADRCKRGPWHAQVRSLDVRPCDIEVHLSFTSKPTAGLPTHG